jgi:hypothetical protein
VLLSINFVSWINSLIATPDKSLTRPPTLNNSGMVAMSISSLEDSSLHIKVHASYPEGGRREQANQRVVHLVVVVLSKEPSNLPSCLCAFRPGSLMEPHVTGLAPHH